VNAPVEAWGLARFGCRAHAIIGRRYNAPELPRGFFEPARHVHDIAHNRELDAPLRPDVADDHRTEMDADGDRQPVGPSRAPLGIPSLDRGLQFECAGDGARPRQALLEECRTWP
jgi:hypothetical protein